MLGCVNISLKMVSAWKPKSRVFKHYCGVAGHFAERHFAERHLSKEILPNDNLPKDILPNGQFAENRDIFWTLKARLHYESFCD